MMRAKKSDTLLASPPACWAPVVTVTVPALLFSWTDWMLLSPSLALDFA